ncbi:DUF1311 domain-containing protein [Thalassotalea sp. HSM 43]|uniref:lysozyme inhibitor LprI family protein n=1 Tax=Thalassotalea sp. HSM 43 TaxID=2552945 RepID=UPI00108214D2|nr:lysozyme inhibitor LprI family protein [Thalassotalea sp. HSM 43]QBY03034.1 DUF1311 domain-containing protein [Thalassotalea sp. HSM 43]
MQYTLLSGACITCLLCAVGLLPYSPQSIAKSALNNHQCDAHSDSQVALSECLDVHIKTLDSQYQDLLFTLEKQVKELASITGRDDAVIAMQQANQAFSGYRLKQCQLHYQLMAPGSGAGIEYKRCYIRLTQARMSTLQTQLSN